MSSLVLELQRIASDGAQALPDVLRKAKLVAAKLKLAEAELWINYELNGYPVGIDVPKYRILHGEVRAYNPYNGAHIPFRWSNPDQQVKMSTVHNRQSIGSLAAVLQSGKGDWVQVPFSDHALARIHANMDESDREWCVPTRWFAASQVESIFDAVRNQILDWTLTLEAQGILGEGMTFTEAEKGRAAAMTHIHIGSIGSVQGVVGSISESTVTVDNVAGLDKALEQHGFSEQQRIELQQLIAEFKGAPADSKASVAKRGIQWVVSNAQNLGTLAAIVRDFFGTGEK